MRTPQQRMQIYAIEHPERTHIIDNGDYVLIVDGYRGPYIKKDKLIINQEHIRNTHHTNETTDYKEFRKNYVAAKITKHIILTGDNRMHIKIKAIDSDNYCWVRYDWMKEYGNDKKLYIHPESRIAPVYIEQYGEPCGIVLPVNIMRDTED